MSTLLSTTGSMAPTRVRCGRERCNCVAAFRAATPPFRRPAASLWRPSPPRRVAASVSDPVSDGVRTEFLRWLSEDRGLDLASQACTLAPSEVDAFTTEARPPGVTVTTRALLTGDEALRVPLDQCITLKEVFQGETDGGGVGGGATAAAATLASAEARPPSATPTPSAIAPRQRQ